MQLSYAVEAELLGVQDFYPLKRTVADLQTAESRFYGARVGRRLVGVLELAPPHSGTANIDALVVDPQYFRLGTGSALIQYLREQNPSLELTVSTGVLNQPARRLYQNQGFCETHRWTTEDGIAMVSFAWTKGK